MSTFSAVIYMCNECQQFSMLRSRITDHQRHVSRCANKNINRHDITFTLDVPRCQEIEQETYEDKVRKVLCTRVPSGFYDEESDHGLQERCRYLVADEQAALRKALFRGSGIDASVNLLRHLWGSKAPAHFRSYVTNTATRTIYVLKDVLEEGDPSACILAHHTDREECLELVKGIYYALLEIADAVINECKDAAAEAYRDKLYGSRVLHTHDVFDRNHIYASYRIKEQQRVTFANKLRPALLTEIRDTVMKRVCDTA